jgi:glycine/D-amino acid oxidase-like deaminating enzyme
VVVIGAGITGLSAAYWLVRAGVRVAVLEQEAVGAGATGRNAGFIPIGTAEPYPVTIEKVGREAAQALWMLTERNYTLVGDLILEEEIDCDFREPGHLHLAISEQQLLAQAGWLSALWTDGFRWGDMLDRRETQEEVLSELGPRVVGALRTSGALAHSGKLLAGLAVAAERRGVRFHRAKVRAVEPGRDAALVRTASGEVSAATVIVASNAQLGSLLPSVAGVVEPVRGQMLVTRPLPRLFPLGMTVHVTESGEYWQQTPSGEVVLGGCRARSPVRDRGTLSDDTTEDVQAALRELLPSLFPGMPQVEVTGSWAGTMGFTPDSLPVVDHAADSDRIWCAGAYSGHGMALAPIVGALMSYSIVSGAPAAALGVFGLNRASLRST